MMTVQSSLLHTRPAGAVFDLRMRPIGRDARIDSFMSHLRALISPSTEPTRQVDEDHPDTCGDARADQARIDRRHAQTTPPAPSAVRVESSHIGS